MRRAAPIVVGCLLLAALAAAGMWWRGLTRSGRPQRQGEVTVAGLAGAVSVRFDDWGVPHVGAERTTDLAAAVGWLHANDRFTQLELGRRLASGRLAELVGDAALSSDGYYVSTGFRHYARQYEAALEEESRALLAAYARGVNAWLEARGDDLPPELALLGATPEPWSVRDSLYFQLQMAHDLSFWQGRPEEPRLGWLGALGPERFRNLLGDPELHLPDDVIAFAREARAERAGSPTAALSLPPITGSPGSNNWVVAGTRTASGAPILANDPHLPLAQPGVWYQVQLRAPGYEAAGLTLPGMPFVVIGQGPRLAWGFTNVMLDDHDLYLEELDTTGTAVRRGDRWSPLREAVETIYSSGGEARAITVRWTDRGVLLETDPTRGLPPRTLAWTAAAASDAIPVFLRLPRARSVLDLTGRLEEMAAPAQNLVAADADGNILHQPIGRVPARRRGDGRVASPGWDAAYGWDGLLPQSTNPARLNPDDGLLVTANHDIRIRGNEPAPMSGDFDTDHRARRIRQLLERRRDWSPGEMAAVQNDVRSLYALEVIAALGDDYRGEAARALTTLRDWDGEMNGGSALLFALLERELMEGIFADESAHFGLRGIARRDELLRALSGELDPAWFDDLGTAALESRDEVVAGALDRALVTARERFGATAGGWSYPALNLLTLEHPLAGLPVLGRRWSRGPFPMAGSATTVAAFGSAWNGGDLDVVYGPSVRWVAVPDDPDASLVMLPTGQSGHPWDRHYDDQLESYLGGRLRSAHWSEAAIEANTVSRLRLVPASARSPAAR